ncbi:MAG: AAA family ATPase, partial [Fimbriimonadaceae bacterium]|nr:AAA family ATPase [Fimbriimonadaceae bacterium]
MTRLLLNSLTLENWKGIKKFTVQPQGQNVSIYGDNATGKTTLADGIMWLFFGKNLSGSAKFEIKPLDARGDVAHNLNSIVTAEFETEDADGSSRIKLSKNFHEVWTKKRGSAKATYDGNTVDHTVDDTPKQEKEYDAVIRQLCDEQLFRLLADPFAFNELLTWQERRKELMRFAGDITTEAVTLKHPELAEVPALLGSKSLEDFRKTLKAQRPLVNSELEGIPGRIDEVNRTLSDSPSESALPNLDTLRSQLVQLQLDRTGITAKGRMAELRQKKAELEAAEAERRTQARIAGSKAHEDAMAAVRAKQDDLLELERTLLDCKRFLAGHEGELHQYQIQITKLLEKHSAKVAEVFNESVGTCESCGQSLPEEQLADRRAAWNRAKSDELEKIIADGKARRASEAKYLALVEEDKEHLAKAEAAVAECKAEIDDLRTRANGIPQYQPDEAADAAAKAEIDAVDAECSSLLASQADSLNNIDTEIVDVQRKIQAGEVLHAKFDASKGAEARIKELEAKEEQLAADIAEIDRKLFLTEQFIRAQVSMLEESINSRFELVKFKLFEELQNGALNEVCETTCDGVPWRNLNHGGRINGGLDIINTLARHYGFAPPIVIDNAESVTSIIPTIGQQIRLVVSAADKALRVESAQPTQKEL